MASSKARGERSRRRSLPHPPSPELPRQLVSRVGYVEDFDGPRTTIVERRVLARRGWAGGMLRFHHPVTGGGPLLLSTPANY